MQYKIPQNISNEDKLISIGSGGLSLRQLIIVGVGGGLAYLIYISLAKTADPIVYIPPMVIISLITLAIAFFRKDNLSFTHIILLFLETVINPTKRVWVNFAGDLSPFQLIEVFTQEQVQKIDKKQLESKTTIESLDKIVQILDYNPNTKITQADARYIPMEDEENERMGTLEKLAKEAVLNSNARHGQKDDTQDS